MHFLINRRYNFDVILLINIFVWSNFLFTYSLAGEDFYELLGVSRDADDRTIRRAFKKLAIQWHPDKNEDPDAHEKFVQINRAYEILKDEEARKKYDLYGENGLKDGMAGAQQQRYQSWQFYKEQFGIYDDDPEISTLNGADFDSLVVNGRRRWFVNFYSAHCSHCHELAPAWRKFARQVEGVIGVGAVNCLDEYLLCQQQRIGYYPMLIMYPEGERFDGSRAVDDLIDYVLGKLDSKIVTLTEDNFKNKIKTHADKPWLIELCNDGSDSSAADCLSFRTRKLVAAALDGSVNVGLVSCNNEEELCERLGGSTGLYYFAGSAFNRETRDKIQSLDTKEIVALILKKMPDFIELDDQKMKAMIETGSIEGENDPWLVYFTKDGSTENLEYRRLPSILNDMKVKISRFNCSKYAATCQTLNLNKFPAFVTFKPKIGFEIHYGKTSLHDVAAFAQESVYTKVKTLSGGDFTDIISKPDTGKPWFIDFFAPWCPPCMRLLPEFRKAARFLEDTETTLRFGTVDCTVNNQACLAANVHSYPTTVLFNGSTINAFVGLHNVQELVDFIEDLKNPPVISLTPELFQERVLNRNENEIWLVDFFSPHCAPCQQLAPEIRKLAKMSKEHSIVFIADLDCARFNQYCQQLYIPAYPTIRIFPRNRGAPMDYNSWFRDAMSLRTWLYAFLPSNVIELTADDFYVILNSEEPWLVDFFAPWCGHCQVFAPEYEKVAAALENRVKVGKINCDLNMPACQSAAVRAYPSVRFYRGVDGTSADSQSAFGIEIGSQNSQQIISFIESLLNQDKEPVSGERHDEL